MRIRASKGRRVAALVSLGVVGVIAYIASAHIIVTQTAEDTVVHSVTDLAPATVVIVPGARVFADGSPSPFLQQRLEAAEALYESETVGHFLMSGDNRTSRFAEPETMRNFVVRNGAAPRDVTLDVAGFDTWDTCIRAKKQFGVDSAVVVTQERFANRTAALCSTAGIDVQVLALPDPDETLLPSLRSSTRERLATVKAWGDIVRTPDPAQSGDFIGLVGSEPR